MIARTLIAAFIALSLGGAARAERRARGAAAEQYGGEGGVDGAPPPVGEGAGK